MKNGPQISQGAQIKLDPPRVPKTKIRRAMAHASLTLNDGGYVPTVGIGTGTSFKGKDDDLVTSAVVDAVIKGYR